MLPRIPDRRECSPVSLREIALGAAEVLEGFDYRDAVAEEIEKNPDLLTSFACQALPKLCNAGLGLNGREEQAVVGLTSSVYRSETVVLGGEGEDESYQEHAMDGVPENMTIVWNALERLLDK